MKFISKLFKNNIKKYSTKKVYWKTKNGYHLIVHYDRNYVKDKNAILHLFNILEKDCPSISDMELFIYAGNRYRKMYGVEGNSKMLPNGYQEISPEVVYESYYTFN